MAFDMVTNGKWFESSSCHWGIYTVLLVTKHTRFSIDSITKETTLCSQGRGFHSMPVTVHVLIHT